MAEDDPDHPEFAVAPEYPIVMNHEVDLGKTYLGYLLAQPEQETIVEIHTDAGVFNVTIPKTAYYYDADNKKVEADILKAGYIYNIVIDIKTDGSLDVVIGNEDLDKYRDLAPYNSKITDFETANCYVVTPEMFAVPDSDKKYEGFYFQALVPGRGDIGRIEGSSAELYPDEGLFSPSYAGVLWQDKPFLVTTVELVHDYVRFILNEKCSDGSLTGNAVIAIYDKDGNIIWSWHIWVVDGLEDITYSRIDYLDLEDMDSFDNAIQADRSKSLTNVAVMNMNLGATTSFWSGSGDALNTYGLYYQWGRKDPSPRPASYNYSFADMTTDGYYYMDEGLKTKVMEILKVNPVVETGARHPLDIVGTSQISATYPNDWLYYSNDHLWGYSPIDKKVVNKTIYDPCPYGYRVADDELYALFYDAQHDIGTVSSREAGWGVVVAGGTDSSGSAVENWFPFSGWRGHDRGRTDKTHAWYNVGNLGDYQDARVCKNSTRYMNHRGRSMIIRESLFTVKDGETIPTYKVQDVSPAYTLPLTTDYANRNSASPVRCVRYDKYYEEPPDNPK